MKKLVLGSLNIDRTYRVQNFVQPKETIQVKSFQCFCGGKGFNQAVSLSRAGSEVYFAGVLGRDGAILKEGLEREHIHTELLRISDGVNGHAVIQVDDAGENCILVVAGSNAEVDRDYISEVLGHFSAGDFILLQNEIPNVDYAIELAREKGMFIAFNPSPFNQAALQCRLECVDLLIVNEVEGQGIAGGTEPGQTIERLHQQYPGVSILMTLGAEGAVFQAADGKKTGRAAVPCNVIDTTAAGDTFTGFFLTEYLPTRDAEKALEIASIASSIAVSRAGAAQSIPDQSEVLTELGKRSSPQAL